MRTNVARTVTTPDGEVVSMEEADRRRKTNCPPVLTPEKRAELLELAKYSMGQPDQKFMLCDFMPCERSYADWLMEELGL